MLLFCFRFSSHLIQKRPTPSILLHDIPWMFCAAKLFDWLPYSIRTIGCEIISTQIGFSLSDEISCRDQMCFLLLASCFLLLFLILFCCFPQTSARTTKRSKKRWNELIMSTRTSALWAQCCELIIISEHSVLSCSFMFLVSVCH